MAGLTMAVAEPIIWSMSEDGPVYKRNPPPLPAEENFDMVKLIRAVQVHKEWIWNDGFRILKLAHRIENLERELRDMKSFVDRVIHPSEN